MATNWLFTELKLRIPVIQAPMAGVSSSSMVVAASKAGILGSLGGGMMQPEVLRKEIEAIRNQTDRPFNINLFVIDNYEQGFDVRTKDIQWLKDYYKQEGVEFNLPKSFAPKFQDQFETLLELAPPVASFAFGILSAEQVDACHERGIRVIGTATSGEEAVAWEKVGADAICAQGTEAGGHRGNFINLDDPGLGLFALIPEIKRQVKIPVIAAGGIMSGQGIVASRLLGADVAQLGTYFLASTEAGIPSGYLKSLAGQKSGSNTSLTKGFSGRYARGIVNKFMNTSKEHSIYPYPIQNALTQPLRKATLAKGDAESYSLWSGQGLYQVKEGESISDLVDSLEREISQTKLP
ncbi:hypothetical protein AWJ20_3930 [Sugiyamaella lignohabitans]|uniref:Uncharacterized protein n=1 Tax=Sugiyamaella lignohabitans TaxID=796027 RepID=A0A161HF82_9ASCO|nr:uncharacterized protein AWJ20_3930 [Sugiyamaella lignohabitans]ANB11131.1 hypothetical protein AWJ20_3930 [Sugiyamaella lignohabitans]